MRIRERTRIVDQGLCRLVYRSHNRIAGAPADIRREIEAILDASRRNNLAGGVTGALIFDGGVFAQLLEGPRREIEATFERIQCDPRHRDVEVLLLDAASVRGFPDWSMAFLGGTGEEEQVFARIGLAASLEGRRIEGERLFELMRVMARKSAAGLKLD
jgi:hypothetical protein